MSPLPRPVAPFRLDGKLVLLTGAAGLYGRGLLADLTAAGARVILASRNQAAVEELAAAEGQRGAEVHALSYDQGDETSILRLR
ncbi:MAG: SDR family NAD(P)-dependent oxidoreductase, partial [Verrucomicrobiota bacterium]